MTSSLARAIAVVLLSLLVGTAGASASPLYAAVYPLPPPDDPPPDPAPTAPGPKSNLVTRAQLREQLEEALGEATVTWRTQPPTTPLTVVAHERTRFVVTLTFGTDLSKAPGPRVAVAWENDALLTAAAADAVRIEPAQAVRKSLADATARAEGGADLEWEWTVTATRAGSTTLLLVIRPLIFVDGVLSERLSERNQTIEIPVQVHPGEIAFEKAVAAASTQLEVRHEPSRMTKYRAAEVVATVPQDWDAARVVAELVLTPREGSTPPKITVAETADSSSDGDLSRTWTVIPQESGLLEMDVGVRLSAEAGDRERLRNEVVRSVQVQVDPTLWERLQAPVAYLASFVGLVGAVLGVRAALGRRQHGVAGPPVEPQSAQPSPLPDEGEH